jgi:hypothetical protein
MNSRDVGRMQDAGCKQKTHRLGGPKLLILLEATIGIEPMNGRFAVWYFAIDIHRQKWIMIENQGSYLESAWAFV